MILVVSAVSGELAGLPSNIEGRCVGVGPIAAAAGTARLLHELAPGGVIFVGTAGVFGHAAPRFALRSAAIAGDTCLVDVAVLRGVAERPSVFLDRFAMDGALSTRLSAPTPASPRARVATTSAITVDDALAGELAAAGFDLENLELAGVAAACAAARVPCASVLGVSNTVGARGRAEWRAEHEAAERAACAVVASALGA